MEKSSGVAPAADTCLVCLIENPAMGGLLTMALGGLTFRNKLLDPCLFT